MVGSNSSEEQPRVLFASFRMCFPFYVGGDGLVVHFLLQGGVERYGWRSLALGVINPEAFSRTDAEIRHTLEQLSLADAIVDKDPDDTSYGGGPSSNLRQIAYSLSSYPSRMVETTGLIAEIRDQVRSFHPDVIITTEEMADEIVAVSYDVGIPVIMLVFHAEWPECDLEAASRKCNLIVFDSEFLFDKYQEIVHCPAEVIYPPIDWKHWIVRHRSNRYISMLNPVAPKGRDVFLEIVAALPNKLFLAQEGWFDPKIDLDKYPNLVWRARNRLAIDGSMGLSYLLGNTRILLVPSQWEDALPTMIIHAMNNGIPVIGSRRGGIPEATGAGGIIVERFDDAAAWVEALLLLDRDEQYYQRLRRAARTSAKRFSYEGALAKYHAAVLRVMHDRR